MKNVIIVDDDKLNMKLLESVLKKIPGISIYTATNGIEVLNMVKKNPYKYQLILMDVMMPGMDGREATQKIKEISNVIVIIQSTNDYQCCEADAFIRKPIDAQVLIATINGYLTGKFFNLFTDGPLISGLFFWLILKVLSI